MKTIKLFLILTVTFLFISCSNKTDKCEHSPKISYNAYQTTNDGDTVKRMTEKGKQGLWVYKKADGSHTDTLYKDGVPQLNK